MADLIDRAALLAAGNVRKMKDALEDWDTLDNKTKIIVLRYAKAHKKIVETAPAVDAVEVVRCEKCIGRTTWIRSTDGAANICGMSGMFPRGETDYCSYSERRIDADNRC